VYPSKRGHWWFRLSVVRRTTLGVLCGFCLRALSLLGSKRSGHYVASALDSIGSEALRTPPLLNDYSWAG
jgi:hypothetical protein